MKRNQPLFTLHAKGQLRTRLVGIGLLVITAVVVGLLWWRGDATNDGLRVYFLTAVSSPTTQLFQMDVTDQTITQLTTLPDSVTGFAVSPDGAQIAFTTSPATAGSGNETIWLMKNGRTPHPLLTCTAAACHNLIWAADGRRLIYERRDLDENGIPAQPHLWWLDSASGDTLPVLQEDTPATAPRLSPDDAWIAYVAPAEDGLWLYHFADGRSHFIASATGTPVAWNPDGQSLLYSALNTVALPTESEHEDEHSHANLATHLFLFDLASGESRQLSADVVIEDNVPAWSPDGEWIAFGRRQARTGAARALWLMRADGSDAHSLNDDPAWNVGPPSWSEDGRCLLFQRYNLNDPQAEPGIWLLELATGSLRELTSPGFLPAWN